MKRNEIYFIIAALILGLIIGFITGTYITIKAGVIIAGYFTNITINEKMINDAIFRYNNNLGECYAPLFNNTRN